MFHHSVGRTLFHYQKFFEEIYQLHVVYQKSFNDKNADIHLTLNPNQIYSLIQNLQTALEQIPVAHIADEKNFGNLDTFRRCLHKKIWYNTTIMREKYSTDLTDEQWAIIAPLFKGMRNRKWSKRDLVDAVLYLVDNG